MSQSASTGLTCKPPAPFSAMLVGQIPSSNVEIPMAQTVGNRYELIEKIGVGGMGIVYRGIDNQTQQVVAIKQLKPEISSPEVIERFKREGEALRQLNHPNIVKMIDTVEQDDVQYLVLEFIRGGD